MSAPKAPRSAATPSYQAKSLASHIRHAVPNKEAWDQLQTEYRRVHGSANDIGLVSDMIAFFLVFLSKERAAQGAGTAREHDALLKSRQPTYSSREPEPELDALGWKHVPRDGGARG